MFEMVSLTHMASDCQLSSIDDGLFLNHLANKFVEGACESLDPVKNCCKSGLRIGF